MDTLLEEGDASVKVLLHQQLQKGMQSEPVRPPPQPDECDRLMGIGSVDSTEEARDGDWELTESEIPMKGVADDSMPQIDSCPGAVKSLTDVEEPSQIHKLTDLQRGVQVSVDNLPVLRDAISSSETRMNTMSAQAPTEVSWDEVSESCVGSG